MPGHVVAVIVVAVSFSTVLAQDTAERIPREVTPAVEERAGCTCVGPSDRPALPMVSEPREPRAAVTGAGDSSTIAPPRVVEVSGWERRAHATVQLSP